MGVYQRLQASHLPRFMMSLRQLRKYKNPISFANGKDWLMDSGAFTELNLNGKYTYSVDDYLAQVEKHQPTLFFNMDYMCEPFVLKKTGKTVAEHQTSTIVNQIRILEKLDEYNIKGTFAGVIQGWTVEDYLNHIDTLKSCDLILPYMGVGSVCRRTSPNQIAEILLAIKKELPGHVKLHGFGLKWNVLNVDGVVDCLYSSDSMAWSFIGRKTINKPCMNCIYPNQKNCANCYKFMLKWYGRLNGIKGIEQEAMS
jgi:hypothetical protein